MKDRTFTMALKIIGGPVEVDLSPLLAEVINRLYHQESIVDLLVHI